MKSEHFELTKLPVTKIDAARRQLETAITLWFHDGDPVSIHTLAAAAYEILYHINRKIDGREMMPDSTSIREEYREEWRTLLRNPQNFFKHADRDPAETLFYAPRQAQALMLEACDVHQSLAHEDRPLMRLFVFYLAFREPKLFLPEFQKKLRSGLPVDVMQKLGKREFFHSVLPLFASAGNA